MENYVWILLGLIAFFTIAPIVSLVVKNKQTSPPTSIPPTLSVETQPKKQQQGQSRQDRQKPTKTSTETKSSAVTPQIASSPLYLNSLKGHGDEVLDFDICAQDASICTCSIDRSARVWKNPLEKSGGKFKMIRLQTLASDGKTWFPENGSRVCISDDGHTVAVALEQSQVINVYEVKDEGAATLIATIKPAFKKSSIKKLDILQNHFIVVFGSETELKIFSKNGNMVTSIDTLTVRNNGIATSFDGRYVAVSGFTSDAKVYELQLGKAGLNFEGFKKVMDLRGHSGSIHDVAFAGKVRMAVTVSRDKTVRVWELRVRYDLLEDPKCIKVIKPNLSSLDRVAFSSDGNLVAIACKSAVEFFCVDTDKSVGKIDRTSSTLSPSGNGEYASIVSMQFSPDSKFFATLCESDKVVNLWRVPSAKL